MTLNNIDEQIKKVMSEQKKAMPITTISSLTGLPRNVVDMKIRKMKKNGVVKLHKTMKLQFYKLDED